MFCPNCGKQLDDRAVICPNCGVPIPGTSHQTPATNTLAVVGFILAFVCSLAGLICSIIARKQIKKTGEGGGNLALAGIIISAVSIALVVLAITLYILFYILFFVLFFLGMTGSFY